MSSFSEFRDFCVLWRPPSDKVCNHRNFSNGIPLESIETEKSRIVLTEVEPQWWILAALDLTQLPLAAQNRSASQKTQKSGKDAKLTGPTSSANIEYSSREVASAQLLLTQLRRAHRGFLLHHAASLSELWKKHEHNRDLFNSLLHRYWMRFVWNWDVLLHGNPIVELYDAVKLAGGGELGIGVGEEDWGSGEREVLEGFAARTEGLIDLLVGRYGDAPVPQQDGKDTRTLKESPMPPNPEPWLGNAECPRAQDGIIFSGIGGISRSSLITTSQWMESIYMHGDDAYGVGENPVSRPRRRRKRRRNNREHSADTNSRQTKQQGGAEAVHPRYLSPGRKAPDLRRKAIENNAAPPGIPAPLVSAVERALDDATAKALAKATPPDDNGVDGKAVMSKEKEDEPSSMFGTDKMLKYLSLGYGTSWTLNPKGFGAEAAPKDDEGETSTGKGRSEELLTEEHMQELDPTPEASDEDDRPFVQRLEQSIGKFLIGLSGDLENTEFEDESNDDPHDRDADTSRRSPSPSVSVSSLSRVSNRIFLRTLLVEMSTSRFAQLAGPENTSSRARRPSLEIYPDQPKTSASASVDGTNPIVTHEKVRVAVYVHQPFIFVFLFQLHTPNLTIPSFYRAIHHTLGPLQKSLLKSTDPQRWAERMKETLGLGSNSSPDDASRPTNTSAGGRNDISEIYDLIYDPEKSTVRTSVPNIPLPGSLAAEGLQRTHQVRPVTVSGSWYTLGIPIGSSPLATGEGAKSSNATALISSNWTRIEALNVHTHILNMWSATRDKRAGITNIHPRAEELERTEKTARGWWVVWMKAISRKEAVKEDEAVIKEAILVRRSPHERSSSGRDTSRSGSDSRNASSAGRWLLRDQPRSRDVSGAGSGMSGVHGNGGAGGGGVTNAKGVTEGVGVDARKWVEGLIRLSL